MFFFFYELSDTTVSKLAVTTKLISLLDAKDTKVGSAFFAFFQFLANFY